MPELPDLLYIQGYLRPHLSGRTVLDVGLKKPVVLRVESDFPFQEMIVGRTVGQISHRGPFIRFPLDPGVEMIVNLMVAGRIQHQLPGERTEGYLCFFLELDDRSRLNICDPELMAKVYIVPAGKHTGIPKYVEQGVDILSDEFTFECFRSLAVRHGRKQVRTFINDQTILSAIGNAYADEILFDAGIHPKTFVRSLSPESLGKLYSSIGQVIRWGSESVRAAGEPIHKKVRSHMKIRNRKGEPCPRCSATIRREGVRGYDVFFCPSCQPATRKHFINWGRGTE